jgi:hypothetical protein
MANPALTAPGPQSSLSRKRRIPPPGAHRNDPGRTGGLHTNSIIILSSPPAIRQAHMPTKSGIYPTIVRAESCSNWASGPPGRRKRRQSKGPRWGRRKAEVWDEAFGVRRQAPKGRLRRFRSPKNAAPTATGPDTGQTIRHAKPSSGWRDRRFSPPSKAATSVAAVQRLRGLERLHGFQRLARSKILSAIQSGDFGRRSPKASPFDKLRTARFCGVRQSVHGRAPAGL